MPGVVAVGRRRTQSHQMLPAPRPQSGISCRSKCPIRIGTGSYRIKASFLPSHGRVRLTSQSTCESVDFFLGATSAFFECNLCLVVCNACPIGRIAHSMVLNPHRLAFWEKLPPNRTTPSASPAKAAGQENRNQRNVCNSNMFGTRGSPFARSSTNKRPPAVLAVVRVGTLTSSHPGSRFIACPSASRAAQSAAGSRWRITPNAVRWAILFGRPPPDLLLSPCTNTIPP